MSTNDVNPLLNLDSLRADYLAGRKHPRDVVAAIHKNIERYRDHNIWIHALDERELAPYLDALAERDPETHPLWGIPFAIKDNIDLAGVPTTAACEAFRYVPEQSAFVVKRLINAGAIPIGKTNLDQFATGLNGTRSPYGECKNAFNPDYISGGSSSGSAVALALGLVSFSLGTDTAGSGRVPAAFNNLVGVKPTRGLLSARGMVPACRSLDCMTIFALNCSDANQVLAVAEGNDDSDAFSRSNPFDNGPRHFGCFTSSLSPSLKVGILPKSQLRFFGDEAYQQAYEATLKHLLAQDVEFVEVDYAPFDECARLLYEGPWVAERYLATQGILEQNPESMHPVVRGIVEGGREPKATALFQAEYRLEALRKQCQQQLQGIDCLLTPTAGKLFTREELRAEPVQYNSDLGYYTNFMNLLDLSALALPTAFTDQGLPFGITLCAPAFQDRKLLSIGQRLASIFQLLPGASNTLFKSDVSPLPVKDRQHVDVLVCGAHLEGLPLNWQLTERGAVLLKRTQSAPSYRMYALAGGPPKRPGMIRDDKAGVAIDVEIWRIPRAEFGSFVADIPAPLGIGKVEVASGDWVCGFICEASGLEGAEDITHFGGWRDYMASLK